MYLIDVGEKPGLGDFVPSPMRWLCHYLVLYSFPHARCLPSLPLLRGPLQVVPASWALERPMFHALRRASDAGACIAAIATSAAAYLAAIVLFILDWRTPPMVLPAVI